MAYSLEFFGNEYIDVGADSSLAVHTGNGFTLEGWFYYDGSDNANPLFHKKSRNGIGDTELEYMLSVGTSDWYGISDEIHFAQCGNDAGIDNVMNENEWNYVAITVDTTSSTNNVKFYVNNSFIDSKSVSIDKTDRGYSLSIGAHWTADGSIDKHLIGKMDQLRIWNYIRSESELMDNKNKSLTGSETGFVAYWKLNEGSGDTINDSAGSNNGTIYGSYSWSSDSAPITSSSVTESRTVNSFVNNIQTSTELNKTVTKQVNSYISSIQSNINIQKKKVKNVNVKSYINNIYTNTTANLKIHKKVTVNSYINKINSKANKQICVFRKPISCINLINANGILPNLIVTAYSSIEQNNSSISILKNLSSISVIQNPSYLGVI